MSTDPASKYTSYGTNYCTLRNDSYDYINPEKADLSGRNVLITGASRGIGRATAIGYARAGASAIAIAGRSSLDKVAQDIEDAAKKAGRTCPKVIPLTMDITKQQDVEKAAENVKTSIGHLDIVILNSGALENPLPITEQDPAAWWDTWNVNVFGQFLTLRSFLPLVVASPNKDKTVIGLSSIGATFARAGMSAYQPTKLAFSRIMEFVNSECGDKGVLAYSIHPGGIPTPLALKMDKEILSTLGDTPELAGDTLVFLTRERRDWLAGRYISCQWDMQEFEAKRAEIEKRDLLKFRLAMGGEDPTKI